MLRVKPQFGYFSSRFRHLALVERKNNNKQHHDERMILFTVVVNNKKKMFGWSLNGIYLCWICKFMKSHCLHFRCGILVCIHSSCSNKTILLQLCISKVSYFKILGLLKLQINALLLLQFWRCNFYIKHRAWFRISVVMAFPRFYQIAAVFVSKLRSFEAIFLF